MKTNPVVYLIDDDEGVRLALAFLLITAGLTVKAYESAVAFLAAIPDIATRPGAGSGCILTDVKMPGMDGLELQRQLDARQIGLPVVVMTGIADVRIALTAIKAGAAGFIEKPFDDETLISAIRAALDGHGRDASPTIRAEASAQRRRGSIDKKVL